MKNLEILKDKFSSLSKKAKMLAIFVGLIIGIILFDWVF